MSKGSMPACPLCKGLLRTVREDITKKKKTTPVKKRPVPKRKPKPIVIEEEEDSIVLAGATARDVKICCLPYGNATVTLFRQTKGQPEDPGMLVFVAHGAQNSTATIGFGTSAFGFLVRNGHNLVRDNYNNRLVGFVTKFQSAPYAFATAGTPDVYVGYHDAYELQKNLATLASVLPLCDVAIVTDVRDAQQKAASMLLEGKVPLPMVVDRLALMGYRRYLMFTCRTSTTSGLKGKGYADAIWTYDDEFHINADDSDFRRVTDKSAFDYDVEKNTNI
ncbi:hypothetical protein G6O69_08760 [Pseudenhygromyxa sp. WMMC2535]|uniref:hypothetical protein n=1 Tax=Pseudenhygromyxa sp. WMMC2535 TaxID=2712867 RepID=UPI0015575799|nr:hypothetical protein [Pseudenhygromyxa sp. WMMC2535]NVB37924.1 hypothetical protein [Pseudenhygromyxa sp. WMMC2535]